MPSNILCFRVRSSSSDEVYDVEAVLEPDLRITCTCKAGLFGSICKHRTALLLGDVTSVVEVDARQVEALGRRAAESQLGATVSDLSGLEAQCEKIKREIAAKKKQIARLMSGG